MRLQRQTRTPPSAPALREFPYVRDQNPLGPGSDCRPHCAGFGLGATQWTAWQLGYQPELGRPWFVLMGHPIYAPPAFFWWWYFFDAYAPKIFIRALSSPPQADLRRSPSRSACLYGVPVRRRMSRPTGRRAGRRLANYEPPNCLATMASFSAAFTSGICAMMVPSMYCVCADAVR